MATRGVARSGLRRRAALDRDRGSAAVEFVLVGALTTIVFAGVLQLALALHVRTTLIDCAAEGAHQAALVGNTLPDGVARTEDLITTALAPDFARDVTARRLVVDGVPVVEVTVTAPLPVAGLLGPGGRLSVTGRALDEAALVGTP